MLEKYVNVTRALYASNLDRARMHGKLSPLFNISSGVKQKCLLSISLFNFSIDEVMEATLIGNDLEGGELFPGDGLQELEYAKVIDLICDSS